MPENAAWQLEDFVDSLVVELDKTRETLAVKAINKPLSYTVKDLDLDLNIFPSYDGDHVSFVTAQPGQEGSSKVTIKLGSITDQQVRATSKAPVAGHAGAALDQLPVDKETKTKLRRIGVTSVDDLKQIEDRHVDLKQVTDNQVDYSSLAKQIAKSRRDDRPPNVSGVSLSLENGRPALVVAGRHLAVDPSFAPVAVMNGRLVDVHAASPDRVELTLPREHRLGAENELVLTFDPFAVVRLNVRA